MKRRSFLQGLGALTALAAVDPEVATKRWWALGSMYPPHHLWGDGVHDDTAALQWRIDHGWEGGVIPPARYLLTDTLRIERPALITHSLLQGRLGDDKPVLWVAHNARASLLNNIIESGHRGRGLVLAAPIGG